MTTPYEKRKQEEEERKRREAEEAQRRSNAMKAGFQQLREAIEPHRAELAADGFRIEPGKSFLGQRMQTFKGRIDVSFFGFAVFEMVDGRVLRDVHVELENADPPAVRYTSGDSRSNNVAEAVDWFLQTAARHPEARQELAAVNQMRGGAAGRNFFVGGVWIVTAIVSLVILF
jgi:hypothetical protein